MWSRLVSHESSLAWYGSSCIITGSHRLLLCRHIARIWREACNKAVNAAGRAAMSTANSAAPYVPDTPPQPSIGVPAAQPSDVPTNQVTTYSIDQFLHVTSAAHVRNMGVQACPPFRPCASSPRPRLFML